jgi:TRAP-type C4-dicarboxylate transport system permease large subunit
MFLGEVGPGVVMVAATAAWGYLRAPKTKATNRAFDWAEARAALPVAMVLLAAVLLITYVPWLTTFLTKAIGL